MLLSNPCDFIFLSFTQYKEYPVDQLPCNADDGVIGFQAALDVIAVGEPHCRILADSPPRGLDEGRPEQGASPIGDTSDIDVVVRAVHIRYEPDITGQMVTVDEVAHVRHFQADPCCGEPPDAGNGQQQLIGVRVMGTDDLVEPPPGRQHLRMRMVEVRQQIVQTVPLSAAQASRHLLKPSVEVAAPVGSVGREQI